MGVENVRDSRGERTALVVVHGVAPHPRYEFQDQCAAALRDHLNDRAGAQWVVDVLNPPNVLQPGNDDPQPTISRVRREDDDSNRPSAAYFDVTEAYWSPIDKGHTNALSVVAWILKIVFVPFNTTARIDASWQKQFFDYTFIGGALLLAFALFALSIDSVWQSLVRVAAVTGVLSRSNAGEVLSALNGNVNAPGHIPVAIVTWLLLGTIGAFLVGQGVAALFRTWQQRKALAENTGAVWHRALAIAVLLLVGATPIYGMANARFPNGNMGWDGVAVLVLIFVAFQIGRGLIVDFIVGFFGDVQIYSTRDENDSRFYHLRNEILDVAVSAIMNAVSPDLNGGRVYDRVVVLAHSLGATIATDALTRLHQLVAQGALTAEDFARIRSFIMLGSSLEKTKYFFEVAGAATTASYEAWTSKTYAELFTADPSALQDGDSERMFWINYWYFEDPICNAILSYSDICRNEQGTRRATLLHPVIHSDYLADPWVWRSSRDHLGVLEIIAPRNTRPAPLSSRA
jgi:pimeloyl-ACP methyl ester carboxylesterase